MFEQLLSKLRREQADLDFELARCEDMYRLRYLLDKYVITIGALWAEADTAVEELEEIDR